MKGIWVYSKMIEYCIHILINTVCLVGFILGFGSLFREIYLGRHFQAKGGGYYKAYNYITYYISALLAIQLSEYIYYEMAENLYFKGSQILLTSGASLTIIIICSGRLIDSFHRYSLNNTYKKLEADMPDLFKPMKEAEKTYIICWSSIVSIITSLRFHYLVSLYAVAIFLGRFFWYDSNTRGSFREFIKSVFKPMDDSNKEISGSITIIKNWMWVGGFLYVVFYTALEIYLSRILL